MPCSKHQRQPKCQTATGDRGLTSSSRWADRGRRVADAGRVDHAAVLPVYQARHLAGRVHLELDLSLEGQRKESGFGGRRQRKLRLVGGLADELVTFDEEPEIEAGTQPELQYDEHKRLWKRLYPSPTSKGSVNASDFNEYDYDNNGNVFYERKRNGQTINYSIDANNRVTFKNLSDNTYSADITPENC
jgi:hypothetical protein